MRFSYNWLKTFFSARGGSVFGGDKKLPKPEELAELLTMHSFEVGEISEKNNDWILDIDILPNRASDCLSHYGLAREISGITGNKLSSGNFSHSPVSWRGDQKEVLRVEIYDKDLCPRYSAYVIEGVRIQDSPAWIKERLEMMEQKEMS